MKKVKKERRIKVSEAADMLGIGVITLRTALQQGKFEFGTAIKTTENRWTYYINTKKFYEYLEGKN